MIKNYESEEYISDDEQIFFTGSNLFSEVRLAEYDLVIMNDAKGVSAFQSVSWSQPKLFLCSAFLAGLNGKVPRRLVGSVHRWSTGETVTHPSQYATKYRTNT